MVRLTHPTLARIGVGAGAVGLTSAHAAIGLIRLTPAAAEPVTHFRVLTSTRRRTT